MAVRKTIGDPAPLVIVLGPRVFSKVKRVPGRHGGKQVTTQNLQVVQADSDRNLLLVKGPVPGPD